MLVLKVKKTSKSVKKIFFFSFLFRKRFIPLCQLANRQIDKLTNQQTYGLY
ncbi:hypothetical protein HMPREF9074_09149 [Capnocytophaga sp. oral taxon 329 str. F0087]|nr:hypothetical protein HMPREF9074_09149 [Capnocytophaga sp. oral taxon 329 str. F0087]